MIPSGLKTALSYLGTIAAAGSVTMLFIGIGIKYERFDRNMRNSELLGSRLTSCELRIEVLEKQSKINAEQKRNMQRQIDRNSSRHVNDNGNNPR